MSFFDSKFFDSKFFDTGDSSTSPIIVQPAATYAKTRKYSPQKLHKIQAYLLAKSEFNQIGNISQLNDKLRSLKA